MLNGLMAGLDVLIIRELTGDIYFVSRRYPYPG
jgi:isocitrate/isopropylmalate dehydrogenase